MYTQLTAEQVFITVVSVLLVMVSASFHEYGHALAAYRLGDDTAKRAGRLTINPLAHIDRFGSVILPLVMGLAGGPVFAFAKPVPYNPRQLRNPRRDEVIVALAGPATNLLQAGLGSLACHAILSLVPGHILAGSSWVWLWRLCATYVYVNCLLAFFNLIPLPPLDGSAIISPLLTGEARRRYYVVQHYSLPILIVLLYLLPSLAGVDPLGSYLDATAGRLTDYLLSWG